MDNLDAFDPASWHDAGVVGPLPVERKRKSAPKLRERVIQASASVLLSVSAVTMPVWASMALNDTSELLSLGARVSQESADTKADPRSSDHVDPAKWRKLIALLETLPSVDRSDPPDLPPPFI